MLDKVREMHADEVRVFTRGNSQQVENENKWKANRNRERIGRVRKVCSRCGEERYLKYKSGKV